MLFEFTIRHQSAVFTSGTLNDSARTLIFHVVIKLIRCDRRGAATAVFGFPFALFAVFIGLAILILPLTTVFSMKGTIDFHIAQYGIRECIVRYKRLSRAIDIGLAAIDTVGFVPLFDTGSAKDMIAFGKNWIPR
jgi:hypothetical protein